MRYEEIDSYVFWSPRSDKVLSIKHHYSTLFARPERFSHPIESRKRIARRTMMNVNISFVCRLC
jgi:hypothetical protein